MMWFSPNDSAAWAKSRQAIGLLPISFWGKTAPIFMCTPGQVRTGGPNSRVPSLLERVRAREALRLQTKPATARRASIPSDANRQPHIKMTPMPPDARRTWVQSEDDQDIAISPTKH